MLKLIAAAFAAMAVFSVYLMFNVITDSQASVKEKEASHAEFLETAPYYDARAEYMDETDDIIEAFNEAHELHVAWFSFDKTNRTFYEPEFAELPDRMDAVVAGMTELVPPPEEEAEHQRRLSLLKDIDEAMDKFYVLVRKEYMGFPDGDTTETSSFLMAHTVRHIHAKL